MTSAELRKLAETHNLKADLGRRPGTNYHRGRAHAYLYVAMKQDLK